MNKFSPNLNNYKQCEYCGRPLPNDYPKTLCPTCLDKILFSEVKEFIRNNDVNEFQVAEHFNISIRQVKEWIRQGRIEYKEKNSGASLTSIHCQRCGSPVNFGTLCPKCLKLLNSNVQVYSSPSYTNDSEMHYLKDSTLKTH